MKKIWLSLICLLSACASEQKLIEMKKNNPMIDIERKRDPFEALNRKVMSFNIALDRYAIKHIARAYKNDVNNTVRLCVSNFLHNLHMPFSAVFRLFSLDIDGATKSVWRFVINTFLGVGGVGDPAKDLFKISVKEFRCSDMLASWNIQGKPYIVLPFMGPSSPRDIIGFVGDIFLDPLHYIYPVWFKWGQKPVDTINDRTENFETVSAVFYKSIDPYLTIRNFYLNLNSNADVEDIDLSDFE